MAFLGSLSVFLARLIFIINGTTEDNVLNILVFQMNFLNTFVLFQILSLSIVPQIRVFCTSKAHNDLVLQQESNQEVDSGDLATKKKEAIEKNDENPPPYSKVCIISEN